MKKGVIIQASSRSNGDTSLVVRYIQKQTNFDVIDLLNYTIGHFDYEFKNKDDDFNALFKKLVSNYDTLVIATPIYWYTMSGLCKVFLDRMSDFLFQEKDFGRMLRGKQLAVISSSNGNKVFKEFDMPFRESANYLGMNYLGHTHTWLENKTINNNVKETIQKFLETTNCLLNTEH